MIDININFRSKQKLFFEKAHYYIEIPIILDKESRINKPISFIVDTGAFVTIINRRTAKSLEIDLLPVKTKDHPLGGFAGSTKVDLVEVPQLIIADRTITDIIVAIPQIETTQNLLGLNVLEFFNFYIDTDENYIYFQDSDTYKTEERYRCGEILSLIS